MASSAQVRAWAAENGHPELGGGRGKIPQDVWDEYAAAHAPADDYGPGTSAADFPPDPGFVTADQPPDMADWVEDGMQFAPGSLGGPEQPEERPQRPRGRGRFSWRRPKTAGPAAGTTRRERKTWPRLSVAPLIEDAYSDLAWASAGIPPLSRLFYAQAPVAGVILDPAVKDTVADRVLQPLARNYEVMKAAMALLGTPATLLGVLATAPPLLLDDQGRPLTAPVIDQEGRPVVNPDGSPVLAARYAEPTVQHATAMVGLRYCVRAMVDLAGDSVARVQERAEAAAGRDDLVNEFIGFLLGTAPPEDAGHSQAREGRDAGLRLAGVK